MRYPLQDNHKWTDAKVARIRQSFSGLRVQHTWYLGYRHVWRRLAAPQIHAENRIRVRLLFGFKRRQKQILMEK